MNWLTNCPDVAKKLRAADKAFDAAKVAASDLPLAAKVEALRTARVNRVKAYASAVREHVAKVSP